MGNFVMNVASSLFDFSQYNEWEKSLRFFGIKLIDLGDFAELLLRFTLNTAVIFFILQYIYMRHSKAKGFYFSYMAIGSIIFLLCFLLNSVKLEMGFALGLFAIFGIIRYRTDAIPIKEMTYLFVVIGVAVMNALANKKVSYAELIITNMIIFWGLWFLERRLKLKREYTISIVYDNIKNIHSDNYDALIQDLKERTGITITHFDVVNIDYLKDAANIVIYYSANEPLQAGNRELNNKKI